jgi:hypothetical protein
MKQLIVRPAEYCLKNSNLKLEVKQINQKRTGPKCKELVLKVEDISHCYDLVGSRPGLEQSASAVFDMKSPCLSGRSSSA